MVREWNGLQNTTLVTYLESTSVAFIPYLAEIARRRGSDNLEYTSAHGPADIGHAQDFLYALDRERKEGYGTVLPTIDATIVQGHQFLKHIFVKDIRMKE